MSDYDKFEEIDLSDYSEPEGLDLSETINVGLINKYTAAFIGEVNMLEQHYKLDIRIKKCLSFFTYLFNLVLMRF